MSPIYQHMCAHGYRSERLSEHELANKTTRTGFHPRPAPFPESLESCELEGIMLETLWSRCANIDNVPYCGPGSSHHGRLLLIEHTQRPIHATDRMGNSAEDQYPPTWLQSFPGNILGI